ncbi:hypothetical protein ANO14919_108760 [Xylariales sp. No.14919]|nr:hypothetical protein ANO14919_108760 [Xylariales sp. No.14919]
MLPPQCMAYLVGVGVGVDEYEDEEVVVIEVDVAPAVVVLLVAERNVAWAEATAKRVTTRDN